MRNKTATFTVLDFRMSPGYEKTGRMGRIDQCSPFSHFRATSCNRELYIILGHFRRLLLTGTFINNHPFFTKVLNAALFVGGGAAGYRSFIKPVCSAETAPLYNMWTMERGFALDLPLFQADILADLSCKKFRATAFSYPPRTTIKELPDGTLKWAMQHFLIHPVQDWSKRLAQSCVNPHLEFLCL